MINKKNKSIIFVTISLLCIVLSIAVYILEKSGGSDDYSGHSLTSPTAEVGAGTVVLPLAIINTDCRIQSGCIINCGSIVDHGCVIEEGVHISPGTVIKAENRIPRATKIEAGEVVPLRAYPL